MTTTHPELGMPIIKKPLVYILILLIYIIVFFLTLNIAEAEAPKYVPVYPSDLPEYKYYAYDLVSKTWDKTQWEYFDDLIQRESSWCSTVWNGMYECTDTIYLENPTNGSNAYGLGQTMVSLHEVPEEFYSNPDMQIEWVVKYIKSRYGNPEQSIIFHNAHNYY